MKLTLFSPFILLVILFFSTHLSAANKPLLGINTNEVMQIDSSVPFLNLFKQALPFAESRKLTKGNIIYDRDGWPRHLNGGVAGTNLIHWLPAGTLPEGNYTVLYDGEGTLVYGDDDDARGDKDDVKLIKKSEGKEIIRIRSGQDRYIKLTLRITESTPSNYLRNIRLLPSGGICANNPYKRVANAQACRGNYLAFEKHYDHILFNPDYLNFMRHFKVIRFMNMSGITRNPMTSWNHMPHMTQATWAGKEGTRGAPLEVMVKLANKLNARPWFTLPHAADNNLIQQYARYVKQHLRPHLKPYIEYTNETWNGAFTQAHYTKTMGIKQRLDTNRAQAGHKFYVKRSLEIMRIWEQVYGGPQRITRVLGGFAASPKMTELLLSYKNAYQRIDAFAIAPYFYVHHRNLKQIHSVPDVFKLLKDPENPYSLGNVYKMLEKQMTVVKKYKVKLIAYEGGQHLVAAGTRSTKDYPNPFLIGANRANPMEKMYIEYLQNWARITGNGLMTLFSAPKTYQFYGSWGLKEHINQPDHKTPKYRGVKRFF
ncbi:MAG: hypothetical protein KAG20_07325 [Cocleimonas sp.]|nr:hypothetical protein [Cocleimonas sp.]